jgi:hypothetical protein
MGQAKRKGKVRNEAPYPIGRNPRPPTNREARRAAERSGKGSTKAQKKQI